jgi:hypothetical protein
MADRGKDDPNIGKAGVVRLERTSGDPMVKMQHATDTNDYTLTIGTDSYPVTGGAVEVPMSQVAAAEAAGFHTV